LSSGEGLCVYPTSIKLLLPGAPLHELGKTATGIDTLALWKIKVQQSFEQLQVTVSVAV